MKRVLSVRIDNELYTKVNKNSLPNSKIVSISLNSYLNDGKYTNEYDKYTLHLEKEIEFLRSQVNGLMLAKIPLLSKIKMKLLENSNSTS